MPDYFFRDDLEAEKDRQAKTQESGLSLTPAPASVQTMTAPKPAAQGASPYAAIGKTLATAKPTSQAANPFESFRASLDAQDPFKAQTKGAITDTLANPAAAADEAAGLSRDRLAKAQQVEEERRRQAATTAYGGAQTGQVARTLDDYSAEKTLQTQDHEGQLRAERLAAIERNRSSAIGQATQLLGQDETAKLAREGMDLTKSEGALERGSREGIAFAGLSLEEKKLAQEGAQFATKLDFDKWALQKGLDNETAGRVWQSLEGEKARTSTEKIAFAQLSQQDKELAQQAMQFKDRLSWDREAMRLGLDDKAADRIWQSAEGEKTRLSQEKMAYAEIGSREKLQASAQTFEAAQANLNRSLEQLLSNDRIGAQFKLADMDAQVKERMQATGFVQEKELQTMRDDLEKSLQERGINADTAKQIADQKFTEMMAGKDQAFQVQMNEIKEKFLVGERIAAEEWEGSLRAADMQHEELMTRMASTLRLNEAGNAQAFQTAFQQMQNEYQSLRDNNGFSHEKAMQQAEQMFTKQLTMAGFNQERAIQATQLATQVSENQKNRASQEMMSAAQLAQTDKNFQSELYQRYAFNEQDVSLRMRELEGQLEVMGLQGEQLKAAISDGKISSAMNIAALGMEIGDGSADSMAPFVEALGTALEGYMKGQGIDISSSDFVSAMTKTDEPTPPGAKGTYADLDAAIIKLDEARSTLPASVNVPNVQRVLKAVTGNDPEWEKQLPMMLAMAGSSGLPGYSANKTSQAGKDYAAFYYMTNLQKMSPQVAADLLKTSIGENRFKASYKALTGKDWA